MVGVLALQGNYQMHSDVLSSIGQKNIFVKSSEDLLKCKALIIPGGESTVISKMMIRYDLFKPIKDFSNTNSVFGTCAGLVLMSNYNADSIAGLNIINAEVLRNGWGRQIHSFTENIKVNIDQLEKKIKATFIRAPRIKKVSSSANILANFNKEAVMVREGRHLATTFHPELHNDFTIHKYFLQIINEN